MEPVTNAEINVPSSSPTEAAEEAPSAAPARSSTVQSVEVAVQILEAIAESGGAVRVTELSRLLHMTKARVSRHLQTLLSLGLVEKSAGVEGYTFGWKLMQLGRAAVRDRTITELAKPHLMALRDTVGQTVILSLPSKDGSVVVLCVESAPRPAATRPVAPRGGQENSGAALRSLESHQGASVAVRPGTFLEYPKSPAARLAVALAGDAAKSLAGKRGAKDPHAAAALASLARLNEVGADYELDTQGTGLGGVAAPVFDDSDKLAGVVSLVMPTRFVTPAPSAEMLAALKTCVEAIEAEYKRGGPA
ncbi:MAG: helix-turn-helix domain-containing protein [Burkholderiaceae bacterium]|nr:helix-turn-helix domain-containing protein [Burkholderiaceae bacterium]